MDDITRAATGETLDPADWKLFRTQAHRMLDDMLDYIKDIRGRPVWQPMPPEVRLEFRGPLPETPTDLASVYRSFSEFVLPYATGNVHPAFMGWVHGGGTAVGMLGEMLAAGLNPNCGGRDHAPIEVERQIVEWAREIFGFPPGATGIFVTGTSMANFIAILIARTSALGTLVRREGVGVAERRLTAYASAAAHMCVSQAMDLSGLGSDALRLVPVDEEHQINLTALRRLIAEDRAQGFQPFLIVGTAGTVDIGAIDDLAALADLAEAEGIWFHIDGAFGALGMLAPDIAPRLKGIERAASIALDFHKWGQVPYDAGFVIVRDGDLHRATFAAPAAYLGRDKRGLAAGGDWPCDLGPDLSRGFRALKTWFTLKVYGTDQLGASMSRACSLARYLASRVAADERLELLAPVPLNIVCFRFRADDADRVNAEIVADLQESGIAAPSTTRVGGHLAIRAAIVNHRMQPRDVDAMLNAVIEIGERRLSALGRNE